MTVYNFYIQRQNGIWKNILLSCQVLICARREANSLLSVVNDFFSIFILTPSYVFLFLAFAKRGEIATKRKGSGKKKAEKQPTSQLTFT